MAGVELSGYRLAARHLRPAHWTDIGAFELALAHELHQHRRRLKMLQ
jgi:hypothetical protein